MRSLTRLLAPLLFATFLPAAAAPALAAGAAPAAQPAAATSPQATSASYADWTLRCVMVQARPANAATPAPAPQKHCEVDQNIAVRGQTTPVAQIAVGADLLDGSLRLAVQLPIGAWLPAVPAARLGAAAATAVQLAFKRCLPGACIADAALTDAMLKAMQTGTAPGQLTFQMTAGHDVALPISFNGFSAAFAALQQTPK